MDIGTNSVLMLLAEVRPSAEPCVLADRCIITRLGQGVDRTRRLHPDAIARTLSALIEHVREAGRLGARVVAVGTSALRDAANAADFTEPAERVLGASIEIVAGDREAELTFAGALYGLPIAAGAEVTVLDVGGGSTEVVWGRAGDPRPHRTASLDVGSVRLTERHVRSDPPTAAEIESLRADVRGALLNVERPLGPILVGIAGTVTTLAAVIDRVDPYDRLRIHGRRLGHAEIEGLVERLARMTTVERTALSGLPAARADVIVAGGWIVVEAVRAAGPQAALMVSDGGVRWGLLAEATHARARS